ncbi:MAG: hypothetical protein HXS54_17375 [Theionarchaea archaeon]|nr:hypothetical protein [Theionarchaea archaeon]
MSELFSFFDSLGVDNILEIIDCTSGIVCRNLNGKVKQLITLGIIEHVARKEKRREWYTLT